MGNFLLSHTLARAVPSGLRGLTSVFGMGTGGTLSLGSPKTISGNLSHNGLTPVRKDQTNFSLNIDGHCHCYWCVYYIRCLNAFKFYSVFTVKFYGQAERAISNGQLHALLHFHTRPINVVVFHGPSKLSLGRSHLREGFALICIQRLSRPDFATQLCHWCDNWITRDLSNPVLSY